MKKSLYGLKQSSRCWNQVLDAQLKGMGFQQSQSDPCIYTSKKDGLFIIAVYVDDILLCAKSEKTIAQVKQDLEKCFQLKDIGELHYFLGINVKRNYETGKMWIGQPEYTKAVLKNFGMEKCKCVCMCVRVNVSVHVCTCKCVCACVYVCMCGMCVHVCDAHVCIVCMCVFVCTHVCVVMCICVSTYVCVYMHMYTCMHMCGYVYVCAARVKNLYI